MKNFDIQTVAPEGYVIIDYRRAQKGEYYRDYDKTAKVWCASEDSLGEYFILKKLPYVIGKTYLFSDNPLDEEGELPSGAYISKLRQVKPSSNYPYVCDDDAYKYIYELPEMVTV